MYLVYDYIWLPPSISVLNKNETEKRYVSGFIPVTSRPQIFAFHFMTKKWFLYYHGLENMKINRITCHFIPRWQRIANT